MISINSNYVGKVNPVSKEILEREANERKEEELQKKYEHLGKKGGK